MTTAPDLRFRTWSASARARATLLAEPQGGVVSYAQLREIGLPHWFAHEQVKVGRWVSTGGKTVAVHNGPLSREGLWARAVLELGPRAALAGVSALQHDGVDIAGDGLIHVIVPKGAAPHRIDGVRVHESRRFRESDVLTEGLRRERPSTAAVHAALWSRTDREATLMLTVAVQHRLVSPVQLLAEALTVSRHRRRRLLLQVTDDLAGGVRSLGELDVARRMRERGLPEPRRQAIRRRPSGTQFLDADFEEWEITMEIDGWQHSEPEHVLSDTLRDLDLGAEGRTIARIPLIAWRLDEVAVLDALERLFRSKGWRPDV